MSEGDYVPHSFIGGIVVIEKIDRKKDPYFFETIMCSCGSKTDLKMHKYSDEIKCSQCVEIIENLKSHNEEGVREKLG